MVNVFPEPIKLGDDDSCSTQSDSSDLVAAAIPNSFEGPEKNLEIDFKAGVGATGGFRNVSREQIDAMLDAAQCTILSKTSNEHIDAYVLSESSLFVYSHKIVIKTCGTTTLLLTLPFIQKYATALGMAIEWVSYSRKNYTFPEEQKYPHTSYQTEVEYLETFFPHGTAHVLGPLNHDHWYIYVWDAEEHDDTGKTPLPSISERNLNPLKGTPGANESTLHVLMQEIDPQVAKRFFKNDDPTMTSRRMTIESGIRDLVPGAVLDDFAFDPCGYSMNGILFDAYYTIHITPESHCSYVSFETNARLRCYDSLLKNVLRCFRPAKYSVSVYADRAALETSKIQIFSNDVVAADDDLTFKRRGGHTQATFEGDYLCLMANWHQTQQPLRRAGHKFRSPSFA
jgi:S-adenosylmethionine decarboxylase